MGVSSEEVMRSLVTTYRFIALPTRWFKWTEFCQPCVWMGFCTIVRYTAADNCWVPGRALPWPAAPIWGMLAAMAAVDLDLYNIQLSQSPFQRNANKLRNRVQKGRVVRRSVLPKVIRSRPFISLVPPGGSNRGCAVGLAKK